MVYQNEIHVDHIKAEHAFLARTIEPVPTADCILQELPEETFSVTDHDEIQNEFSKSKQANVLLGKIAKNNGVVLNCFLHAVEKIRHVLPGTSILKRLKSSVPATGLMLVFHRKDFLNSGNRYTNLCATVFILTHTQNWLNTKEYNIT